jgi:hypothetical protein
MTSSNRPTHLDSTDGCDRLGKAVYKQVSVMITGTVEVSKPRLEQELGLRITSRK